MWLLSMLPIFGKTLKGLQQERLTLTNQHRETQYVLPSVLGALSVAGHKQKHDIMHLKYDSSSCTLCVQSFSCC